ncbi:MAG: lytic transglycosylase domain-containing protein [Nitrospiraceae bacterium]|nr:lytic transglycosylase domain-containing protein [Nitrospiraceae bacterium]
MLRTRIGVCILIILNWLLIYKFMFIIVPLQIEDQKQIQIGKLIEEFHVSPGLAQSFFDIGTDTHLDPFLLCSIAQTESGFRLDARSPKNYKGILQTPIATMKWADVDILIGARILKDKLWRSNGDLLKALQLYKGGNNPEALKEAKEVLRLYDVCKN